MPDVPAENTAPTTPKPRYRVSFYDAVRRTRKRYLFSRESDAKQFFVRLATSDHVGFAELAVVEGVRVIEVMATHFPDEGQEGGRS